MSWEGYYQSICKRGHQFNHGPDYGGDNPAKCPVCKSLAVWSNMVDCTNDDEHGRIRDFTPVMITPEIVETCNLGHKHIQQHATYRIPEKNELKRWWKDWEKNYAWEELPPKKY